MAKTGHQFRFKNPVILELDTELECKSTYPPERELITLKMRWSVAEYRKSIVEAGQIGEVVQNGGLLSALKYSTAILFVIHVEKFAI